MTEVANISPILTVSGPSGGHVASQLAAGLSRPLSPGEAAAAAATPLAPGGAAAAAPTAVATAADACTAEQTSIVRVTDPARIQSGA